MQQAVQLLHIASLILIHWAGEAPAQSINGVPRAALHL